MSDTYNGILSPTNNGFTYNGTKYKANDKFGPFTACDTLGFLNASRAANPDKGYSEEQKEVVKVINAACQSTINGITPSGDAGSVPADGKPADAGGDSGEQQGAPQPKIAGSVGVDGKDGVPDAAPPPTDEATKPADGEASKTHGGEQPQQKVNAGDPVDIFSGAFYLEETDLTIPNSIIPIAFTRFYRSGAASYGPFGWNWDHNLNLFLRELNTGDLALWRNLHEDIFKFDGIHFEPPRGIFEKVERTSDIPRTYEIKGKNGSLMHFERPGGWMDAARIPITWISDQHGNKLEFTYGPEDKLAQIKDEYDRFFSFDYDSCGLLVAVSDQTGRKFTYEHDEQTMQLMKVTSPPITDHPGGISRIYYYEDPWALPELRHNIIRVEDAEGNVYLENTYEKDPASLSYARLTEQLYGNFLFQFRYTPLQYVPEDAVFINIPCLRVEVMNPDFGVETYTFNYRGDLLDRRYRLSKDHSYRVVVWQYEFDEQGNPAKTTNPDGSEEIYNYDFANTDPRMRNNLLQKEITSASGFPSPSRIIWKGKYEPDFQKLIEEKNELGILTSYKYDFDLTPAALTNTGKLMQVIHPDATLPDGTIQSSITTFENNSRGQITAVLLPDGTRNEFTFGIAGNDNGRLISQILDAANLHIEEKNVYDATGFKNETIDGNGHTTMQIFNALGLLEKTILPAVNGSAAEHVLHYDGDRKVIATDRPKGQFSDPITSGPHITDLFKRDVLGNVSEYTLSSNTGETRTVRVCNDFRGQTVKLTHPDGSIMKKIYDERGLLIGEELTGNDGAKISSKKVYDRSGKLLQETNDAGVTVKYEYEGFSRLFKVIHENGTTLINKWLPGNLLASEETIGDDGSGTIRQLSFRSFDYDEKNRKIKEIIKIFENDPTVSTDLITTYFYDTLNQIVKAVNNRNGATVYQYDGAGRMILETDPEGNEKHHSYDQNGNLLQTEDHHLEPDGSVSFLIKKYRYDERNRRIEMIEPDGSKIISEYDDRNLLVKQTDKLGIVTLIQYNSYNDKIRKTEDPTGLNIASSWKLDNMSRIIAYTDPQAQVSDYLFDSLGRNYKTTFPNGFSSLKTFNTLNQVIREQLVSGVVFEYQYDVVNRISKIINTSSPAPIQPVAIQELTYDGLNRVISAKSGASTVSRTYDCMGRLLSENTLGITLGCKYNDVSGEVEKTWPDGRKEKLTHNLNGVLSKIEQTANGSLGSPDPLIATIKTSGPSTLGKTIHAGFTIENSFDDRKRITEITVQSLVGTNENIKYRYDRADTKRLSSIQGQLPQTAYFEFDNKNRLLDARDGFSISIPPALTQTAHDNVINQAKIAAALATQKEAFTYNASDARLKYTVTGNPDKNYTYLSGYEIQSDGTNAYTHFADGSLKADGNFEYTTDALGRVVVIKAGVNIITEISYDAFGRPESIRENGKPDKTFHYLGGFVEQENENGIAARQISLYPGTGIPIAYHSSIGTHYTLFDSGFNLTGLLNTDGTLVEMYRYKAFGTPQLFDQAGMPISSSAFNAEPVFGGQKYLSATGLYLSKKRLMNPVNGLYLSGDPKGFEDSPSLYVYAAQNPVNNIDPNGEVLPIIAAAVIIGALLGAGYSVYDAATHPDSTKYDGWGALKAIPYTFGGAAVGGLAAAGGEAVLAMGGTGAFAATGTTATLSATQTFFLYGASSAVSGAIGREGFHEMFPEYIDPVSVKSVGTDFIAGGSLGVAFRGLTKLVSSSGYGVFISKPGMLADWLNFSADAGGGATVTKALGPYPGRIGTFLDKIGIRQGSESVIENLDKNIGKNIFATRDTAAHEAFHAFVDRYLPTFSRLSLPSRFGAYARYPEEVIAYAIGRGAAGRIHGIPFAPFEAFNSLVVFGIPEMEAAKLFWGRLTGAAGVGIAEQLVNNADGQHNPAPAASK